MLKMTALAGFGGQAPEVGADNTGTMDLDFIAGTYVVEGVSVAASAVVDQPELIGASGLAVPNGGSVIAIIGDALTVLTDADWTLVVEYEDDGAAGTTYVIAVTSPSPLWSQYVQIQRRDSGSGRVMEAYDEDGGSRFVQDPDSHGAGIHKIALTRIGERLAMSVDGDAVVADETGDFTPSLTAAAFGGLPDDFTGNACNIRALTVYLPKDDSELPGLST